MPVLQIVVEPELAEKVQTAANKMGHSVSSFGRYWLRRIVDADAVTVEECKLDLNTRINEEAE